MVKRRSSRYIQAFQRELEARVDYLPHSNPNRRGMEFDSHQRDAMRGIAEAVQNMRKRICLVSSCGSGKTPVEIAAIMASQAAKQQLGINGDRKDLLISDGRGPIEGIVREFGNLGIDAGIFRGGEINVEPPVIITNSDMLLHHLDRYKDLDDYIDKDNVDLAVVDEADLFLTTIRRRLLETLDPSTAIGFTATDEWPDGRHIKDYFGAPVFELPLIDGIDRRINAVPEILLYETEISEDELRIRLGDYDQKTLDAALKHAEIHKAIPKVYRQIVGNDDKTEWPTLINVPSVKLVEATAETMREEFGSEIEVAGWTGKKTSTNRMNEDMGAFRAGEIQVIVFCEMGGRGMNLENAMLMIDGYPTLSLNKLEQRHGRVLRRIRKDSPLWKMGWRKNVAVIAQLLPESNKFRPALFTDLIEGYAELQRIHGKSPGSADGAPEMELIDSLRRRIEGKNHAHNLRLIADIDALEHIRRRDELPRADESGFFRLPRRYIQQYYESEVQD